MYMCDVHVLTLTDAVERPVLLDMPWACNARAGRVSKHLSALPASEHRIRSKGEWLLKELSVYEHCMHHRIQPLVLANKHYRVINKS